MKYRLWDIRRLGLVPQISEANVNTEIAGFGSIGAYAPGVTVNDSPLAQQVAANYLVNIYFYDFIRYGASKDFNFWVDQTNAGQIALGLYRANIKTPIYPQLTKLLQDVPLPALNTNPRGTALGLLHFIAVCRDD